MIGPVTRETQINKFRKVYVLNFCNTLCSPGGFSLYHGIQDVPRFLGAFSAILV